MSMSMSCATQLPISGFESTVKRATKLPPGTPSPVGNSGGCGSAWCDSPSSLLPAGSTRLSLTVSV